MTIVKRVIYTNEIFRRENDGSYVDNTDIVSVDFNYASFTYGDMCSVCGHCPNLISASNISNNVVNLSQSFEYCTNLSTPPSIPNSVTDMDRTFFGCSSLVNAPIIPNNVEKMQYSFSNCYNLTGDIHIKSPFVANADNCFSNTTSQKNVYIPYTYPNGTSKKYYCYTGIDVNTNQPVQVYTIENMYSVSANILYNNTGSRIEGSCVLKYTPNETNNQLQIIGNDGSRIECVEVYRDVANDFVISYSSDEYSQTYNTFTSLGYDENGTKDGVHLINSEPPIDNREIDLTDWNFTLRNGVVTLTGYKGNDENVVVPNFNE